MNNSKRAKISEQLKAKFHYTDPTGPARTQRTFAAKKVRAGPCGSGRVRVVEFSYNRTVNHSSRSRSWKQSSADNSYTSRPRVAHYGPGSAPCVSGRETSWWRGAASCSTKFDDVSKCDCVTVRSMVNIARLTIWSIYCSRGGSEGRADRLIVAPFIGAA